jgi:hypothetical protein
VLSTTNPGPFFSRFSYKTAKDLAMNLPLFPGWHLIGAFPANEPNDVGSWVLHHEGEALLLEIPPGLTAAAVESALATTGSTLRFATASHDHCDHFDQDAWQEVIRAFPRATFLFPSETRADRLLL